jgi:NAD(P)-dependent dehydrogenase (short-subunit alcohol dehydrogenase family)
MSRLDGKTAVITGATPGTGLATARLVAAEGTRKRVVGQSSPSASTTESSIQNTEREYS